MKKILKLLTLIISFTFFIEAAHASSFGISASSTTVTVGNTVKITVSANDMAGKFTVTSSNGSVLSGGKEEFYDNNSDVIYFQAQKEGSATISLNAIDVTDYSGKTITGSRSVNINVVSKTSGNSGNGGNKNNNKKPVDINKNYSSDNTLKNLEVEGYDIGFSEEKLEYELELDQDVAAINVKATPNDDNANVIGAGEVKLTDGVNVIKIVVVAENGNEKTYQITATVKDLNPIKVKVKGKNYNVVKKVEQLSAPENFRVIEADIDSKKVPALYNDLTGYILVGLKDDEGHVKLYVYSPNTNSYSLYNEVSFNNVKLYYTKPKSIPKGFKKVKININDEKINAYTIDKNGDFYLVYGMNVNTGEIGWYRYDSVESTLQRYETKDLEELSIINNKYLTTIVILSVSILMLLSFMLILMVKIRKQKN